MKKILFLTICLLALAASAQGQWINNTDETSFNFIAPDGATSTKNEVLFPFSEATTYTANNDTLTLAVTQFFTFYSTASDSLIASTNFYLTIDAQVTAGAILILKVPAGHLAQSFIPKTGITGTTVAGVAHKTKYLTFIYNGSTFIHIGTMQIN
jgi:hypothetical protein